MGMLMFAPLLKRFPKTDPDEPNWRRPVLGLVAAVLLLASLPLFYQAWLTRWVGWDYCAVAGRTLEGFWPSIRHLAQQAGYSYPAAFFSLVIGVTGSFAPRISAILLLVLTFAGVASLAGSLGNSHNWRVAGLEVFDLAVVAGFLAVFTAPDAGRLFYWVHTAVISTLPLVLWLFLLAGLLKWVKNDRKQPVAWLVLVAFIASLLTGSFTLPQAAVQSVVYLLTIAISYFYSNSKLRIAALSGLTASLTAIIGLMLTHPLPAADLLQVSLPEGIPAFVGIITGTPVAVIAVALMSFSLAMLTRRDGQLREGLRLLVIVPVLGGLVLAAARIGAAVYPDASSWIRRAMFYLALAAWFHTLGSVFQLWRRRNPRYVMKKNQAFYAICIVLLSFFTMNGSIGLLESSISIRSAAEALDDRAEIARAAAAAGKSSVVFVPVELTGGVEDLDTNPLAAENQCAAAYYGIAQVEVWKP